MAFLKNASVFAILFTFAAMLAAAEGPAPAPSHAPSGLASFESVLIGFMGLFVSFFVLKQVVA
ncbi:hypothetical protein LguiA_017105 [Lonicera macranthoides]